MKLKEFLSKWKEGIMTLPPEKQLEAKVNGIIGTIGGLILGFTVMVMRGMWYFIIAGIFIVFLQCIELISTKQQLENIKRINSNYVNLDGNVFSDIENNKAGAEK